MAKYKIFSKISGSNATVWNKENDCALLRFNNGECQTDDIAVAERAKVLGYDVEGLVTKSKRAQKSEE